MFRTGDKADFERMLDDILSRAKTSSLTTSAQVEAESAARGASGERQPQHARSARDAGDHWRGSFLMALPRQGGAPIDIGANTLRAKLRSAVSRAAHVRKTINRARRSDAKSGGGDDAMNTARRGGERKRSWVSCLGDGMIARSGAAYTAGASLEVACGSAGSASA